MDEQHDDARLTGPEPEQDPRSAAESEPGSMQEQERVRRLLAAASAPTERMPEEVADRLDDLLASLVPERDGDASPPETDDPGTPENDAEPSPVPPTSLDARRRHRWPQLLVAAVAVSVLALGIGDLARHQGGGQASSTAGSAGGSVQPNLSERGPRAADQQGPPAPLLRTATLRSDAQRVEDRSLARPVSKTPAAWRAACVHPATGSGDEWLAVRLDGDPAVLVLRAPEGGRRTADVYTCDDAATPAASATVEAR